MYIHIPFCRNICKYCDFTKMYYDKDNVFKYLEELRKEVLSNYKKDVIKTLYIGGGTPSILNDEELNKLFDIIKFIKLDDDCEFTFECNIEDINDDLLSILKENKVNRLSIGIQSFNKEILKFLGRNYQSDYVNKIKLVKKYFDNFSIDLIYGIKGQSIKDLKDDLNQIISFDSKHISIYCLILENNTILKINNYQEASDNIQRNMYEIICNTLKGNNYNHYEISSFAKEGYESKHNLVYWNNEKYYGFGLGASGFIDKLRYTNTKGLNNYLNGNYVYDKEIVTKKIDMENEMILGLRKIEGVNKNKFEKKFNLKIEDVFDISKLSFDGEFYFIDEEDLFVSNSILCDFINI